ncbi:MAG: hypothetical protein AAB198_01820 [Actinomycetota bacterium]
MRRIFALLVVLGACSSAPTAGTVATTSTTMSTTTTTLGTTTVTGPAGTETTTTIVPRVRPQGEDAPDFTLALGEGGTFVLSEEHRPVFLLFWAEW